MIYFNEDRQYLPKERIVDSIYLIFKNIISIV